MSKSLSSVLTGDLVASTHESPETVDRAMQRLEQAARDIGRWSTPPRDTRFTRFRGDGWQMLLDTPALSLRAAVVMQGQLLAMGMQSRIFIGIGPVDRPGTATLSDAAGKAFETSGRGLDTMGNPWTIGIDGTNVIMQDHLIADLIGERIGRWTAPQAEAAKLHLSARGKVRTLAEIGAQLDISPQAVNDRLRGAGAGTIASVLRRWEAAQTSLTVAATDD